MILTDKQMEMLLTVATKVNADGQPMDLDELAEAQSYPTNKSANRHRVRFLINNGLAELHKEIRRERVHSYLTITKLGRMYAEPYIKTLKDELLE